MPDTGDDSDVAVVFDEGGGAAGALLGAAAAVPLVALVLVLPAAAVLGGVALLVGGRDEAGLVLLLAALAFAVVVAVFGGRTLTRIRRVEVRPAAAPTEVRLIRVVGCTVSPLRELYRVAVVRYAEQSRSYPWVVAPTGDVLLRLHFDDRVERIGRWRADAGTVAGALRRRLPGTQVELVTEHRGVHDPDVVHDRLPEDGVVLRILRQRPKGRATPWPGYLYGYEAHAAWSGAGRVADIAATNGVRTRTESATGTYGSSTWTVYRAVDVQRVADRLAAGR